MKLEKLLALLGLFAVLAGAVLVKKVVTERAAARSGEAPVLVALYPDVSAAFVDTVTLYKGKDADATSRVVLSKAPSGDWKMSSRGGARAARATVEGFLKAVGRMKGEPRAQSSSVLKDFRLTEEEAVHVELARPGGKAVHFLVSPIRPGRSGNFVRDRASDSVVVASEDLLSMMGVYDRDGAPNYKSFADLQVVPLDLTKVERAELATDAEGRLALVREGEGASASWRFDPADGNVDRSKVTSFLAGVYNLYASDVPASPPPADAFAAAGESWLLVKEKDAPAKALDLGSLDPDQKAYLVRVRPEGLVYRVPQAAIEGIKKTKSFFKAAS
ncbi:MAG TPA: DUF4340 domain-containing protein [Candidatus Eisenbacteria bacterium]|jgi:hypothetical protein|nr:DUF4340 domain-containing protein [Candidatus Eisenbacteria bacterium]